MAFSLENSVARVLADGADPNKVAGSAFLFFTSNEKQLWMTCHHVIKNLAGLRLAIYNLTETHQFDCSYREALSSVQTDVAILESALSTQDMTALKLLPLPIGSPFLEAPQLRSQLIICGFSNEDVTAHPRGVQYNGSYSARQFVRFAPDPQNEQTVVTSKGNAWNIPFRMQREMHLHEFHDGGLRVKQGHSGSPVCVAIDPHSDRRMCIGMLSARRLHRNDPTHGYVIPYEAIKSSCPKTIPFCAYAECVIVVLAAKQSEFEILKAELFDGLESRLPHYDRHSRDAWKPFALNDPSVGEMLEAESLRSLSWQLSSEYIDSEDQHFIDYLDDFSSGPLVYIVDACSSRGTQLCEIAKLASNHNRAAVYLLPLCRRTLSDATIDSLKRRVRETLGEKLWKAPHDARVHEAGYCRDFMDRFRDSVNRACDQFMFETRSTPRRRYTGPIGGQQGYSRMAFENRD